MNCYEYINSERSQKGSNIYDLYPVELQITVTL